jgi:HAD superfamily hydrolase (TIGR01509 family)
VTYRSATGSRAATGLRSHRGIFLDLDGTLADSIDVMYGVYEQFLTRVGRHGTASATEFDELNGPRLEVVVARLQRNHHLDHAPMEDLLLLYRQLLAEAMLTARPAPGAQDLLARARLKGWATCVVTSSSSDLTSRWLVESGLAGLVDHVVGGEMVRSGKPNPESYRTGLTLCGAQPGASIAVEDSIPGAQSAIAAGIRTFFIVANERGDHSAPPGAMGVVRHLSELAKELDR